MPPLEEESAGFASPPARRGDEELPGQLHRIAPQRVRDGLEIRTDRVRGAGGGGQAPESSRPSAGPRPDAGSPPSRHVSGPVEDLVGDAGMLRGPRTGSTRREMATESSTTWGLDLGQGLLLLRVDLAPGLFEERRPLPSGRPRRARDGPFSRGARLVEDSPGPRGRLRRSSPPGRREGAGFGAGLLRSLHLRPDPGLPGVQRSEEARLPSELPEDRETTAKTIRIPEDEPRVGNRLRTGTGSSSNLGRNSSVTGPAQAMMQTTSPKNVKTLDEGRGDDHRHADGVPRPRARGRSRHGLDASLPMPPAPPRTQRPAPTPLPIAASPPSAAAAGPAAGWEARERRRWRPRGRRRSGTQRYDDS